MDEAAGKNHPEFARIRVLRSTGFLSCQIRAVEENVVPLIANPTMSPMMFVNYNLLPVFCKTKKLHCIWFPAEPSVANDPAAERRGGGNGAAVLAAA